MKKILLLLLSAILLFSVSACKQNTETENDTVQNYIDTENKNDEEIEKIKKELMLLSEDNINFKLNAEISTINKAPISQNEGRGDGFRWIEYLYDDIFVTALIGDDDIPRITRISTTSSNYKTPRDINVGDSLQALLNKYPEDLTKCLSDEICYEYKPKGIGFNRIYFYINNNIITKIVIENGIDG